MAKATDKGVRITKTAVDAAEPRDDRYVVWDSALPGFGVRVSPSGTKVYVARYRAGGGRRGTLRQHVIGRHGIITADQARKKAEGVLAAVTLGEDPQAALTAKRAELTVSELCDLYLKEGCTTKKALTIYTDTGRIQRHIKPELGNRPVSQVTREHVEAFMRAVAEGKTAATVKTKKRGVAVVKGGQGAATRAMGLLGAIFEFAVARKLRADNPVRGVRRFKERKLERFLSTKELARLGEALTVAEDAGANASAIRIIRLLALTGGRRNEIAHLKWSEVDLERGCLRLEDSKTGQKVVPIGAAAAVVLAEAPREEGALYVFPSSRDATKPFEGTPKAWRDIRMAAGLPEVRLHDLRHSFASVGLASGQGLPLIGKLLGHADVGTTQRYAHLADDPVRAAADRIAGVVDGAMRGRPANVSSLKGGSK